MAAMLHSPTRLNIHTINLLFTEANTVTHA